MLAVADAVTGPLLVVGHSSGAVVVLDAALRQRFAGLLPFVGRALVEHAAGRIADDEALESLGVGVDRYAAIDVPVLLLRGERSPAHLRAGLHALAAVLLRAEMVHPCPSAGKAEHGGAGGLRTRP